MADSSNLDKKYIYQIYRSGIYLGTLPNVKSEFAIQQDINSAGTSLVIEVGDTPDTQFEAPEPILTEDGNVLTDELGQTLYTDRKPDLVGNYNSKALLRNNNTISVYEISPTYPNGKIVFSGWISRWKVNFGGTEGVTINCLSNGSELDNYLVLGSQTQDLSQSSLGSTYSLSFFDGKFTSWTFAAQTFIPVATSLSAILVSLEGTSTPTLVTLTIYNSISDANSEINALSSVTKAVTGTVGTPKDELFTLPTQLTVSPSNTYVFTLTLPTSNTSILVDYKNSNVYSNGQMYVNEYGGSGPATYLATPAGSVATNSDLYFKTYYTGGATSSPFNSQDPTAMLRSIIDSYVGRGGTINYATGSTVLTGLTRSYTFKVNTILEAIKKCLELAPSDWYWYVDPATNIIYFKETATTATHTMVYGRHIQELEIEASVEDVKTQVYFTGGDTGGNVYLYTSLSSASALTANANRVGLARQTDNRVTDSGTASVLMQNILATYPSENYVSSITVNANTYDITLFNLGDTVAFASFGTFVERLLLQIVHIERHADYVILGLGVLPRRASAKLEEIQRSLNDVETIYNPTTPS